jgi:hypothetical protein
MPMSGQYSGRIIKPIDLDFDQIHATESMIFRAVIRRREAAHE